jgi:hypothetical protein
MAEFLLLAVADEEVLAVALAGHHIFPVDPPREPFPGLLPGLLIALRGLGGASSTSPHRQPETNRG